MKIDVGANDLDLVRASDEDAAREAFERLWRATLPSALAQFARRGFPGERGRDLAQEVAIDLWRNRRSIRSEVRAEWNALVRRVVARIVVDCWRREGRRSEIASEASTIPVEDAPYVEAFVVAADEIDRVWRGADRLLLGELPDGVDPNRAVAAVQLVLLEGLEPGLAGSPFRATESEVASWLQEPSIVSRALFQGLCWEDDDLAGHVLSPDEPMPPRDLDRITSGLEAQGPNEGWTADEARIVCLRIRKGMREAQIQSLVGSRLDEIVAAIERSARSFPFRTIAAMARDRLADRGRGSPLSSPDLWKRIALEYDSARDLPHKQIMERAAPAADEAGYRLTASTLNNWLSAGRLYAELGAFLAEEDAS